MIVATSGRCEYRNKGIDMFLDAIAALGFRAPRRETLAFVMVLKHGLKRLVRILSKHWSRITKVGIVCRIR